MRSTLLIAFLLCTVFYVHSMSRIPRSPQGFQGQQGGNLNQSRDFQWVKVNGQWVRKDGSNKLPGYSQPNVPYNQAAGQWNTPTPSANRASPTPARPSGGSNVSSQQQPGAVAWNPKADRALTEDIPKTTPRPTTTTAKPTPTTTRAPQTPPPAQKPSSPTPARAPFGSGLSGQQKPRYNPDASLTYGGLSPQNNNRNANKSNGKNAPAGPTGSNPWGNL